MSDKSAPPEYTGIFTVQISGRTEFLVVWKDFPSAYYNTRGKKVAVLGYGDESPGTISQEVRQEAVPLVAYGEAEAEEEQGLYDTVLDASYRNQ